MPSTSSPTSSRSMVSVPQINVVHDIVVEDFIRKMRETSDQDDGVDIIEEGDFTIKIDSAEKDEGYVQGPNSIEIFFS